MDAGNPGEPTSVSAQIEQTELSFPKHMLQCTVYSSVQ